MSQVILVGSLACANLSSTEIYREGSHICKFFTNCPLVVINSSMAIVQQITDRSNRLRLYARAPALSPSRPLRFADGPLNEDFVG